MSNDIKKAYFIGIGGVSMSGLAEILRSKGWIVSGSDVKSSEITESLKLLGVTVYKGHSASNITPDIDLVVNTSAVKPDNPEMEAAGLLGIKIVDRARLLGEIMREFDCPICVAGTHGKTSTTSMVADILLAANMNPTVSVGGYLASIGGYFKLGGKEYFVVESCEYCDNFLKFYPKIGVILNIDADHLDYFSSLEQIKQSFREFAKKIPADGALVVFEGVDKEVYEGLECKVITYGMEKGSVKGDDYDGHAADHFFADGVEYDTDGHPAFTIYHNGERLGDVTPKIHGEHNVLNALAATAASMAAGANFESVAAGLNSFDGAKRRFEDKGIFNGARVIDDYAHHPTEIVATLTAASKSKHKKIYCVFQPHTYTRTKALASEFANSFGSADVVLVMDIYAAREKDTGLIHSRDLADRINSTGTSAIYCDSVELARNFLIEHCGAGDLLITVGAGDVYLLGESLVRE
ncbi:MAG: UDP-N-acetylmuramate--L-alanine ligase [Clostridiales bacterium]|jgi:UDP-N-acetylmuramate--alanine ligase|nr:UDP-N-acetylmuramate--L-alanine ligase [Clostridiales bacterium]